MCLGGSLSQMFPWRASAGTRVGNQWLVNCQMFHSCTHSITYGIFSRGSGFFVWSQRVSEFFVSVTTLCDEWSKFRNRLFLKERFFNLYFKITAFVLNFKKKKHPKIWRPELHKSLTIQHLSHPIFSYSYMRSMESL